MAEAKKAMNPTFPDLSIDDVMGFQRQKVLLLRRDFPQLGVRECLEAVIQIESYEEAFYS